VRIGTCQLQLEFGVGDRPGNFCPPNVARTETELVLRSFNGFSRRRFGPPGVQTSRCGDCLEDPFTRSFDGKVVEYIWHDRYLFFQFALGKGAVLYTDCIVRHNSWSHDEAQPDAHGRACCERLKSLLSGTRVGAAFLFTLCGQTSRRAGLDTRHRGMDLFRSLPRARSQRLLEGFSSPRSERSRSPDRQISPTNPHGESLQCRYGK